MSEPKNNIKDIIIKLELELLKPEVRASENRLSQLLAEDFLEFASSGIIFGKHQALTRLPTEVSPEFHCQNFECKHLTEKVVLLTYRSIIKHPNQSEKSYSLRSSIWKQTDLGWQMTFHQGTKCEAFERS
jgi:hypothetical protein